MSRLALLVANNSFRDVHSTLVSPLQDAMDLREVLHDPAVGNFDPVEVLENESKTTIDREIERLFHSARPGDLVLLYFSGHGVRGRRGKLHLAVSNTDPEKNLAATSISASFIKERIEESHADSVVVLLDCCYSGSFVEPGIKAGSHVDVGNELSAGQGVYILTATNAIQAANDGTVDTDGTVRNSRFTAEIVRGIRTGLADVTGSGFITPQDLGRFARTAVPDKATNQSPQDHGSVSADTVLAKVKPTFGGVGDLDSGSTSRIRLGDLIGPLVHTPDRGLRAEEWRGVGHLSVPIGRAYHGIEPGAVVPLRLGDQGGHFLTTGGISSGKSSLLRTLVCALALTHTPDELRFSVFESGANKLGSLFELPHVDQVVGDDEAARVDATLDDLAGLVRRRKLLFRERNVYSAAQFRDLRTRLADGPHPDVVVIVDQWVDFADGVDGFADRIRAIAHVGRDYGVHLAVANRRWNDIPDDILELFSSYVEFRLPDPAKSRLDATVAARLSGDQQGWALYHRTRFRVALPDLRSDDAVEAGADAFDDGGAEVVKRVTAAWTKPKRQLTLAAGDTEPVTTTSGNRVDTVVVPDLLDLLGLGDVGDFDPEHSWRPRSHRDQLRIAFGVDPDGSPVELDLKQYGADGMGPHGVLIGATGSGKSEALRTLILGLAAVHPPEDLNFVLVDFKGGATFMSLDRLPHTSVVVTNLADELTLVDRLKDVLFGELNRRQELLRQTGNYASRHDYEKARAAGATLDPLPSLVIVYDEFSELLNADPDFMEVLVQIGRVGRPLGVHLLLASQRFEETTMRAMSSFLSYRIGMRTFSAAESRELLGVSDAYDLPAGPGHGYLLSRNEPMTRFRAAYVSSDLGESGTSVMDVMVSRMEGKGRPAHPVWLPPLAGSESLDAVLPLVSDAERGLTTGYGDARGGLRVPVALVDKPREQRRDVLWLDLSGAGGNVAVVGGPQSGKSTALKTFIAGLALTHTPDEVAVYCVDFGGGSLVALRGLPHVGDVYGRRDIDGVRRTVAEVANVIEVREQRFRTEGIDSMVTYRRMRAQGRVTDDSTGDVFLIIDGWETLRQEDEDLEHQIIQIASRGLAFGVHVVVSAIRWNGFRSTLRDLLGNKIELKISDVFESIAGRRLAENVPVGQPGRGITGDGLHLLTILPRIDGGDATTLADGITDLTTRVADAWPGPSVPAVRLLPERLPYESLDVADFAAADKWRIPIGIAEVDLAPVHLDLAADPHFMYLSDVETGKSTFLRQLVASITARCSTTEAQFVVFDYRRNLLGTVPEGYLAEYCYTSARASTVVRTLADVLDKRLPTTHITATQLRDRSWWRGPELFVLVDDYDLVGGGIDDPLLPLVSMIPMARDIGLHVILTRNTAGASRGLFGKLLGGLRNMATPGFQGSGSADEGKLLGDVRLSELPPGRGWLIDRRHGARKIQAAWLPEPT